MTHRARPLLLAGSALPQLGGRSLHGTLLAPVLQACPQLRLRRLAPHYHVILLHLHGIGRTAAHGSRRSHRPIR